MRANKWRDEHEWPLARTRWTRYYLNSGGAANSVPGDGTLGTSPPPDGAPQDTYDYDPANPVPTVGGQTEFPPDQRGPQDRRPVQKRDDVLIYSTPPLTDKLEVTGPIEVKLYAASSAVDTDFTAVLTEVLPDGTAVHISEGSGAPASGSRWKIRPRSSPERSTKSPSRSGRRAGNSSPGAASGWRSPAATSTLRQESEHRQPAGQERGDEGRDADHLPRRPVPVPRGPAGHSRMIRIRMNTGSDPTGVRGEPGSFATRRGTGRPRRRRRPGGPRPA